MQGSVLISLLNGQSEFGPTDAQALRNPAGSDSRLLRHPCRSITTMNTTSFLDLKRLTSFKWFMFVSFFLYNIIIMEHVRTIDFARLSPNFPIEWPE